MTLDEAQGIVEANAPSSYYVTSYRTMEKSYLPHVCAALAPIDAGSALDIGPGWGTMAVWLSARGWDVTVMDFVPLGQFISPGLLEVTGAAYAQTDICSGDGPDVAADLITMTQVIPHLKWSPLDALANCRGMLKEGGRLVACLLDAAVHPHVQTAHGLAWREVPSYGEGELIDECVVCMYTTETFDELLSEVFDDVRVWQPQGSPVIFAEARC